MKKLLLLPMALAGVLAAPMLALLALAGATSTAIACQLPTVTASVYGLGDIVAGNTAAASAPPASPGMPTASPTLLSACQQAAPPAGDLSRRALGWALTHVGDAYVAAAHGPHAWDCSTFTYTAYRQAGLDWPMQISYQQYLDRRHVQLLPLSQAQPGDLLFFDTNSGNSWYNPVTHVAMIVDPVAGTMVHAANPDAGVIISNYKTSSYYQAHLPVAAPDDRGLPRTGAVPIVGRVVSS